MKGLDRLASILPPDTAVDDDDGLGPAEPRPDAVGQIVQRVARLGEDDQLAAVAVAIGHQRVVEDIVELGPLGVGARPAQHRCLGFESAQRRNLCLQLGNGARGRRPIENGFLGRLGLVARCVLDLRLVRVRPGR